MTFKAPSSFEYVLPSGLYFNTPANGVMSKTSYEKGRESDRLCFNDPSRYREKWFMEDFPLLWKGIANQLNVDHTHIALLSSFSVGLNFLMCSLPKNWKIWQLEGDYPSLLFPFKLHEFDIHRAFISAKDLSTYKIIESIEEAKPDAVVLSHVQWLSGFQVDLEKVASFCRTKGIHTIIDGTQFFGSGEIDLDISQIDVYGASGYLLVTEMLFSIFTQVFSKS